MDVSTAVLHRGSVARLLALWFPLFIALALADAHAGGVLRLAVESDPHSLDPAQVFSNEEAMLAFLGSETLLEPAPDGGLLPLLAESLPRRSEDGLELTIPLRRGIRFSNGQELTADDVVFSLERLFDPATAAAAAPYFRSILGSREFEEARKKEAQDPAEAARQPEGRWIEPRSLAGLTALDPHTVRIQLKEPDLAFLVMLTTPTAGIVPRHAVQPAGTGFARSPIGTGPFRLRRWVRGARLEFERNPLYSRIGHSPPDRVDVLVHIDRTTQAMMFERGELDFQHYIPDADFLRFKRTPRLRALLRTIEGSTPVFAFLNCELPPFTNRLVRIALNHAVDRQAYAKAFLGRAVPGRGPLPLTVRGFNQDLPEYRYDPAKARALLAEAGFPQGFATTLWVSRENPTWMKAALLLQQSLREIGVTAELKAVSYPAMLESCSRRRTAPMGIWDWVTAGDDPKETLDSLLNGDNITDEACMNVAFYAEPSVQQWFRNATAEADPAARFQLYRRVEQRVVQDAPFLFLVQSNTEVLIQAHVHGVDPRGFWPPVRFNHCWLDPQQQSGLP